MMAGTRPQKGMIDATAHADLDPGQFASLASPENGDGEYLRAWRRKVRRLHTIETHTSFDGTRDGLPLAFTHRRRRRDPA